jgi:hypothetical protein
MGKRRHASSKRSGGHGPRRSTATSTPTRNVRNAPELSASAAIVMSKALSDTAKTTRAAQAVNILRSEEARSRFIAHVCRRGDASSSDKSLIVFNLEERARIVSDQRSLLRKQARQIINQLGKLAGRASVAAAMPG